MKENTASIKQEQDIIKKNRFQKRTINDNRKKLLEIKNMIVKIKTLIKQFKDEIEETCQKIHKFFFKKANRKAKIN